MLDSGITGVVSLRPLPPDEFELLGEMRLPGGGVVRLYRLRKAARPLVYVTDASVRIQWRDEGDRVLIQSNSTQPGFLVVSRNALPGWRCAVDGTPQEVLRTSTGFLRIAAPAGSHTIELSYVTPGFRPGLALNLCGLLLIARLWFGEPSRNLPENSNRRDTADAETKENRA